MTKKHWFVEQDEWWEDGCFKKTTTWTPVERQEADLMRDALDLKALARAQQKLLEPYRNQIKVIDGTAVRVPIRQK